MKGDVIEVFGDTFAWVFGKAFLFFVAVVTGIGIGVASIAASSLLGTGSAPVVSFADGRLVYVIGCIVPALFAVIFAGMWFVRSDEAGWLAWSGLAAAQAALLGAAYSTIFRPGLAALATLWGLLVVCSAMLAVALWCWQIWRTNRWAAELAMLQAENQRRRAELKEKFGTESAGADELGIDG